MQNEALASLFDGIAVLLSFGDENPFRLRAYSNAAASLRALGEDIEAVRGRGELRKIPGVGEDLAKKIVEYLDTGKVAFYERLRAEVPPFLLEMIRIPGLGPKNAKLIYDRFKPKSFEELEKVAVCEEIRKIRGIKDKTCQRIVEGIAFVRSNTERTLLSKALPLARDFCRMIESVKGVRRAVYAGSVRRMKATVHDVDILVASARPGDVVRFFTGLPRVQTVLGAGDTKASVRLIGGLQVDLRIVKESSFGAALVYFTGSQAHNVKLRVMAKKKGWTLNEYGLIKESTGKVVAEKTEEDIYDALGLAFIPPELREDQGEIEAAKTGKLPVLLERGDLLGDFHMHSNWSDGALPIEVMAEGSRKAGMKYAVLTDHSQSLAITNGLTPARLKKQAAILKKLNAKWTDYTLLHGSEVDILEDGSMDFKDEVLKQLDFVVGSVHSRFKQDKDTMTKRILKAMRNPYVRAIGHPTGRLLNGRKGYEFDEDAVFREAVKTGTAIEINSQPDRLDLDAAPAKRAREMGVRFVVNSDAHHTREFKNLELGVGTARRAWCEKKDVLNSLPLAEFLKTKKK